MQTYYKICLSFILYVLSQDTLAADADVETSLRDLVSQLRDTSDVDDDFLKSLQELYATLPNEISAGDKDLAIAKRARSLASLALGVHYLQTNYRLALQYLTSAEGMNAADAELLPLIQYYLAKAKMQAGAYKEAAVIAERLVTNSVGLAWEKEILSLLIESYYQSKQYLKLSDTFLEYSKRFVSSKRQEDLARMAAETFEKQGNQAQAVEILEELVSAYPTTKASRWAFLKLQDLTCKSPSKSSAYVFPRHLLLVLSRNSSLDTGLKEFIIAAADAPMRMSSTSIRSLTAREKIDFFFHARFYEEALHLATEQVELLARRQDQQDLAERARLQDTLGRIYMRLNRFEDALRHFSDFIATNPGTNAVAKTQEAMADAFKYLGHPLLAAQYYGAAVLLNDSENLRWEQFWNTYRGGAYEQALTMLDTPGFVVPKDQDQMETLVYWRARILEHLGRRGEAKTQYAGLLQTDGQSFYANLVATQHEDLLTPDSGTAGKAKLVNSPGGFSFAAKLISLDGGDDASSSGSIRPELRLVDNLLRVGMKDSAQTQLASISWTNYDDEVAFVAASRLAWLLDDYQPTRRLKFRNFSALRNLPDNWWDLINHQTRHADEWKVYYPLAFRKEVEAVTSKIKLNKFLLLSVMRAESFYNKEARSGVGARGLMQIMPYTAIRLAKLLQDSNFEVASLLQPEVSIGYGGYYLGKLLTYYDNNPFVAVAAYNAGPPAVGRWLAACKDCSVDEFVETIPFRETRRYVREVMRNYVQYLRIYEGHEARMPMPSLPTNLPANADIF